MTFLPEAIFQGQVLNDPWEHTIVDMDKRTQSELLEYISQQDWDREEEAPGIKTLKINDHDFNIQNLPRASAFLKQLQSNDFQKQILEYYNLKPNVFDFSLVFDNIDPSGSNSLHNDIEDYEDVITLQYYIKIDDPKRNLQLNYKTSKYGQGYGIMFKSKIDTMHSFESGIGQRLSVRLRIRHNPLVDPLYVHAQSIDDLTVIIDCKDMEAEYISRGSTFTYTNKKPLEYGLGTFTYHSCLDSGFTNIILFRNQDDFNTAIETAPSNKILVLFAGTLVSNRTYSWAKQQTSQCGSVAQDRILRKFFLFDKSNIKDTLNNKGKYLQDQIKHTKHVDEKRADIFYKHPDKENKNIIDALYNYEPQHLGQDGYRLDKLFKNTVKKIN